MALVLVICCSQQNALNLAALKQQLNIISVSVGQNLEVTRVILVQGLSGSCSQDISGGCHPQRDFCLISSGEGEEGCQRSALSSPNLQTPQSLTFSQHTDPSLNITSSKKPSEINF